MCFSVNIAKFLTAVFLKNISRAAPAFLQSHERAISQGA